ncbi:SDR family NAD(P)-dependent oxidoreductase [Pseudonocardia aurantiaca]|uniref:SDR family NAD(P)-dependent oxidoreductase n=1 Tax=Pseudonocardia aurantiaca TaxID=75290 RepID=A0ABW4FWD3_9PSEU
MEGVMGSSGGIGGRTSGNAAPVPDFGLAGRVAVVTGASSGLGARFAAVLQRAGAHVVIAGRRVERLRAVADDIARTSANGATITWMACDITDDGARERLIDRAASVTGAIDVLVNNAGTVAPGDGLSEALDSVRRILETNLLAVYRLCQLAVRHMPAGGSIVNVASINAFRSENRYPLGGYVASKAGVVGLTRELAAQWGKRGVRVNALAPGYFPTEMTGMLADREQVDWIRERTALGRPAEITELDGPLLFLATPASSYLTGQTIVVDGGWSVF